MTGAEIAARSVEAWNREHRAGTPVLYWPGVRASWNEGLPGVTRTPPVVGK